MLLINLRTLESDKSFFVFPGVFADEWYLHLYIVGSCCSRSRPCDLLFYSWFIDSSAISISIYHRQIICVFGPPPTEIRIMKWTLFQLIKLRFNSAKAPLKSDCMCYPLSTHIHTLPLDVWLSIYCCRYIYCIVCLQPDNSFIAPTIPIRWIGKLCGWLIKNKSVEFVLNLYFDPFPRRTQPIPIAITWLGL